MQYILTEEEYDDLISYKEHWRGYKVQDLQDLCTYACNNIPVDAGWRSIEPLPWGCVLSEEEEWYCDCCPVQAWCPSDYQPASK